jgi:2-haloacid dehalogenase
MRSFDNIEVLTFDCYGTLIDWETGIFSALRPMFAAHKKSLPDSEILELYGDFESEAEAGPYQSYREVLSTVVRRYGQHLGFSPSEAEALSLADSVPSWLPWPDTVSALERLATRYRLAIISNIDDDIFARTQLLLKTPFFRVITAQQARCYKPGLEIFRLALNSQPVSPDRILHVGQSIYHDVRPAQSLGLATVWVNRPSPRANVGAVRHAEGTPDLEVPDLKTLADKLLS